MKFNRRQFIRRIFLAAASIEAIFLIKNGISNNASSKPDVASVNLGKIENFSNGKVYPFLAHKLYVRRMKDGGFIAFSNKCTHLGCMVNFDHKTEGFSCPCHASHFNKLGEVLSAPAPRPLDIIPIKIKNGELYADLSHPKKRTAFQKNQLTYA